MTTTAPVVPTARAPRPGESPRGLGSTPMVAFVLALALIGLGVVGVQLLLVSLAAVDGPAWLLQTLDALDGVQGDSPAVLAAGIVAILLGLLLLAASLRRRPRTGLALRSQTGVFLRRRSLVRMTEAAIDGADGVDQVDVRLRRRTLRIEVVSLAVAERDESVRAEVTRRAEEHLSALETAPRIAVRVRRRES